MLLRIEHLRKEFEQITPLKDVNCEIEKGDIIAVIGPSGCGKSTLINCINRLIEPTSGRIFFDGEEITAKSDLSRLRTRMGMVFQSFHLFPHLTVLENIMAAPLTVLKADRKAAYEKAMSLLDTMGLRSKADRYPSELSGGQQQRVAICRSLAMDPEILLFDEPTSALDPTMVGEVELAIKRLAQDGLTMMIVTHEMKFARSVSNRVFYMDEGGIYEEGTPEEIFGAPKKEKTRWFINRMKVMEETVGRDSFDLIGIQSRMSNFARGQMMPGRVLLRAQLVFEEYFCGAVLPAMKDNTADVRIAYNDTDESVELSFKFPGEELTGGGMENIDPISRRIIEGAISKDSLVHKYENGENLVYMTVGGDRL